MLDPTNENIKTIAYVLKIIELKKCKNCALMCATQKSSEFYQKFSELKSINPFKQSIICISFSCIFLYDVSKKLKQPRGVEEKHARQTFPHNKH